MRGSRLVLGGLVVSAVLLAASPAAADVGLVKVSPNLAAPGSPLEVVVGCGFKCQAQFPVSMVPASRAPKPQPCGNALCSPEAAGPPRSPPFVLLGSATKTSSPTATQLFRLRTHVPRVSPGLYAFVIYARGFLITNPTAPRMLLRVRSEQSDASSGGSGSDAAWWIAGAAGLIAVVAGGVFLHRRRHR